MILLYYYKIALKSLDDDVKVYSKDRKMPELLLKMVK